MVNKKSFLTLVLILMISFLFSFNIVLAASGNEPELIKGSLQGVDNVTKELYDNNSSLYQKSLGYKIDNPEEINRLLFGKIIQVFMGAVGSLALLFFIYGAIMWMMSEGNEQQISKAQKTMVWSAIGLMAVFLGGSVYNQAIKLFFQL